MQDFEDEDQQIEALKQWWKENGKSLIAGVVIGVGGIFGYREYNDHVVGQSQQASDLYNVISAQVKQGNFTDQNKFDQLKNDLKHTPYAAMAAMAVARYHFDKGESDEAIGHLEWARSNTDIDEVKHLASIRLATIHLSRDNFEAARGLLEAAYPAAFTMRYEELKGDLYLAEGDKDKARDAYDKAMAAEGAGNNPLLELKRRGLGS